MKLGLRGVDGYPRKRFERKREPRTHEKSIKQSQSNRLSIRKEIAREILHLGAGREKIQALFFGEL